MDRAMLYGGFIDEAIEVLFQGAGHLRRSSRAWTIDQALDPLAGKTMDPLSERGIGKGEGIRDGVQTLPFHDVAHGLGTAEDTGFFGLLDEETLSEIVYHDYMITYTTLKDRPREFLTATGLTHDEFLRVLPAFGAAYTTCYPLDKTWHGKARRRQRGGGAKSRLAQMEA